MPTLRSRPRVRQPSVPIQDRGDLLHLQFTHGLEIRLRPVDPDGCTDLADDVRAVVGEWLTRPGAAPGPMPLASARLWLRERLWGTEHRLRGSARAAAILGADELLVAALVSEDSGIVVTPLRKRLSA